MAFNFQSFSKDYTSPADQAWRTGKGPDRGTLGPNRSADIDSTSFKDNFVAKLQDNPGYKNFYNGSIYSADAAATSQQQIKDQSTRTTSTFKNPGDKSLADDFRTKYVEGVSRGLIQEEDAVTPDNLKAFTSEPAAARISDKDPNTVNKFPSQGISV
jgi:hypothetical protein